ncbi:hypothetical protein FWD20_01345 [Candidatus Saccharibacteria bacterium]|nr:hypothetical protein [Candidatus Saccharibacteria bacterium]
MANRVLGEANLRFPDVAGVLADSNYSIYFNRKTMADIGITLDTTPAEINLDEFESMPHLVATNWAIAEMAQYICEQAATEGRRVHLLDLCSGSGSTLAAATAAIHGSDRELSLQSVTGIDVTTPLYEQLAKDFPSRAGDKLTSLGIGTEQLVTEGDINFQPGQLQLLNTDVVGAIKELDDKAIGSGDVVIVTANYGLHRIPLIQKRQIFTKLASIPNVVVLIGDLRQNCSEINRCHFNLANNGPLNTGNIYLGRTMGKLGFEQRRILGRARDGFDPSYVQDNLRENLKKKLPDDGFVLAATNGDSDFAQRYLGFI